MDQQDKKVTVLTANLPQNLGGPIEPKLMVIFKWKVLVNLTFFPLIHIIYFADRTIEIVQSSLKYIICNIFYSFTIYKFL